MKLPFSYYLQLMLGLGAAFMLGISAYATVNLPETMHAGNSPFVQGASSLAVSTPTRGRADSLSPGEGRYIIARAVAPSGRKPGKNKKETGTPAGVA